MEETKSNKIEVPIKDKYLPQSGKQVLIFVWEQKCLEGWRKKMKVVLQ